MSFFFTSGPSLWELSIVVLLITAFAATSAIFVMRCFPKTVQKSIVTSKAVKKSVDKAAQKKNAQLTPADVAAFRGLTARVAREERPSN